MFCQKCGKEIADEAVVCPHCGVPTSNYQVQTQVNQVKVAHSNDYSKIMDFASRAKTIQTLGIISVVLCMGIGIFFGIAAWVMAASTEMPTITTNDLEELHIFETAKKRFKLGKELPIISVTVLLVLGAFVIVALANSY